MGFGGGNPWLDAIYGGIQQVGQIIGGAQQVTNQIRNFGLTGNIEGPGIINPPATAPRPPMQAGMLGALPAVMTAARAALAPILGKVAAALGLRSISTARAVRTVRRVSRNLGPAAAATALGLTAGELASLLLEDSIRTRRRTNPLNPRALRRAQSRICSFKRYVDRTYELERTAPRRRTRRSSRGCKTR